MIRNCPVCGNEAGETIRRIHMTMPEGIHLPDHYDIVSCSRCGFCYANTSATKEDYDDYYISYNCYSGLEEDKTFIDVTGSYASTIKFIKNHLKPSDRILDIGFGNGALLSHLRALGYQDLTGIDPSQESVNKLRGHGIKTLLGNVYDDIAQLKNQFDAVTMTTVVEHLFYPKYAIKQASSYLKDGGYLIVSVPDYSMCYTVQLSIPNQFNQEHINYFSETSFANMVFEEGRLIVSEATEIKDETPPSSEFLRTFVIQKHTETNKPAGAIEKDTKTREAIERYLSQQESHQQENESILAALRTAQTPVIVWGTGSMTMSLLASGDLSKCNIITFVDTNDLKVGTRIHGLEVASPKSIKDYPEATILVCAMKYGGEIKHKIEELGLQNQAIFLN